MIAKLDDMLKKVPPGTASMAVEKVHQLVGDFNDAIPKIKGLGLSVSNFRMGMSIIPDIGARLTGSIEALDAGKIKELIESHQDNKVLISILEALRTASNFKKLLSELLCKEVQVDLNLSLPPKIAVNFL
jgi:hypothetical protein